MCIKYIRYSRTWLCSCLTATDGCFTDDFVFVLIGDQTTSLAQTSEYDFPELSRKRITLKNRMFTLM